MSLWTRFEIPSTYSGQATAVTSTSKPPASCVSIPETSASKSARSCVPRGVWRYWAIMSWRAPWRRHQPSASASRWVTAGYVSEPVSSWMPSANTVASSGVGSISRSARIPTSVVVERAVLGEDEVLLAQPLGPLGLVVVEDDHLDAGLERDLLELAQALGVDGLDDDQALDRLVVDGPRVGDLELVGVQAEELADVAVHRSGQRGDGAGIEAPRGKERRERVEVGVRVRGDDVHTRSVVRGLRVSLSPRGARWRRSRPARRWGDTRPAPWRGPEARGRRTCRRPRSPSRSRRSPRGRSCT